MEFKDLICLNVAFVILAHQAGKIDFFNCFCFLFVCFFFLSFAMYHTSPLRLSIENLALQQPTSFFLVNVQKTL